MQKWYGMGLIAEDFNAKDVFPGLSDVIGTAREEASYAAFPFTYTSMKSFESTAKMFRPDTKYELVAVPSPVKTDGDKLHLRQTNVHTGMTISVTKNCKDVEKVIKWIDYMYSPEGTIMFNYGIEGDTFVYDTDGKPKYTDKIVGNPNISVTNAFYKYVAHSWTFNVHWQWELASVTEKEKAAIGIWETDNDGAYLLHPNISLNKAESGTVTGKMSSISTFVNEQIPLYIINENGKYANFDTSFVNQLGAMGIQNVIDAYQTALTRYLSREINLN